MKFIDYDQEIKMKEIFDDHFHLLVYSAYSYVKDYNQAEDIVQDVFVKVWQNFDYIIQIKDIKGYLYKAVKNSSLNYIKHINVRQKFVEESVDLYSEMEKSAEEHKTYEETRKRIHLAVNKLPAHWKEAFVHSRYNNLKYHEIASKMNVSQKTVEKYISKSLNILRNELKDLIVILIIIGKIFFK